MAIVRTSIVLPEDLDVQIRLKAAMSKSNRSAIIRDIVAAYFATDRNGKRIARLAKSAT